MFHKTKSKYLTSNVGVVECLWGLVSFMKNNKELYRLIHDKQIFACYEVINNRKRLILPVSQITTNKCDLFIRLGKVRTRSVPASYFLHLKTGKIVGCVDSAIKKLTQNENKKQK